jgi:hypothetical protein
MNALVSAGLVFGTTKAYGMANTLEIPMSVYSQAAAIMGASKIVADNGSNDPVTRAILSGALYSGISFVAFKDPNWALNIALGSSASYLSDIALNKYSHEINEDEEDTPSGRSSRGSSIRR